jgi:2-polyprenyl-3-methyl-5-hydroxy-6-metoxy-1,4-benzoquinol methylase
MKRQRQLWNHNYAYHRWISKNVGNRKHILDVGCGNGVLARYLSTAGNHVLGIDPSAVSIQYAIRNNEKSNVSFLQTTFEDYQSDGKRFDAIIFVASMHHMNMEDAIEKAKKMMDENGILIIVGLSRPSGVFDWVLELARIIPSKLISAIKRNISSEEQQMDVSYDFPAMDEVRRICKAHLRGCKIRYGLHYRYLLTWENDGT